MLQDTVLNLNIKDRRIQIAGFDRSEATLLNKSPFPSCFRSRKLLGSTAAELLIDQLKKSGKTRPAGEHILLSPKLDVGINKLAQE